MAKKIPVVPGPTDDQTDPEQNQKKLRILEKQKKQIKEYEDDANKSLKRIEDNISKTFKFVCALRLDMVSDLLDKMNQKDLACKIDTIANKIEKTVWE